MPSGNPPLWVEMQLFREFPDDVIALYCEYFIELIDMEN